MHNTSDGVVGGTLMLHPPTPLVSTHALRGQSSSQVYAWMDTNPTAD
jgi:hypothetical protein